MENKRSPFWIPVLMASFLAIGMYAGHILTPQVQTAQSLGEQRYQKIQDIIQILDNKYVDSLNGEELFEKTIADMLHKLDPHSNYIPADELAAINETIQGKFGGIGIRFFIIRDTICVTHVIANSPSERAGLKPGDKIIKIDGDKVASKRITNDDVMSRLKGLEGTDVNLGLYRNGKTLSKQVTRGTIPVESISCSYMINEKIGYVRIDQFSVLTAVEFKMAAAELRSQGMQKLIIDLRDNGGGVLTSATDIADEFLGANVPIVETRGEHSPRYMYRATSQGILEDVEVGILMNSNSASASEILAGAIQDNDRGLIYGRRSFGKGLVQEDFMLRDGSNLRLTVARYYTPTGRCIQKPYSEDIHSYYEDQANRYDNGELYQVDSTLFVDSLKYKTPKGRIVYGGGGIMPDVFIPLDSTGKTWYLAELRYSTAFTAFTFDYVSNKRTKWKSLSQFISEFKVSDKMVDDFVAYAKEEYKVRYNASEFKQSKDLIKLYLKAEIARQLWLESGYIQVLNLSDPEMLKVIATMR